MDGFLIMFNSQTVVQVVTQLIVTGIMFSIMGYFLYEPVKKYMADRANRIKSDIENAEKMVAEAEKLKAEYAEKIKNIEVERAEILDEARKIAKENEAVIISEAKNEANIIKERAKLDIVREQEKAKDDMKREIIDISTLIANRYVAQTIDLDTQNKLFDEIIEDLGDAKWQN